MFVDDSPRTPFGARIAEKGGVGDTDGHATGAGPTRPALAPIPLVLHGQNDAPFPVQSSKAGDVRLEACDLSCNRMQTCLSVVQKTKMTP